MKCNMNESETCVSCAAPKLPDVPMPQLADVAKKTEATAGEMQELCWQIEVFLFGNCSQNQGRNQKESRCLQDSVMNAHDSLCATCDTLMHIAGMLGVPL